MLGNYVRRAVSALQEPSGFGVIDDFLLSRIEIDRAAEPVRSVGEMHQRRRKIAFFDGSVNVGSIAAAHAFDEVHEVLVRKRLAFGWPRFIVLTEERLVGIV